jgi:tripeptidyl-peptidase-1
VVNYLKALGIPASHITTSAEGTFVTAQMPVALANAAFGADFHVYKHPESKEYIVKTESASLPDALHRYVSHVPHVSYFPPLHQKVRFHPAPKPVHHNHKKVRANAAAAATQGDVNPQFLSQYYGIPSTQVTNGATQSVFAAFGDSFSNADLTMFQQQFGLTQKTITKIVGANNETLCQQDPFFCFTPNQDVQYITAVAQGAETTFWSIPDTSNDPWLDWVQAVSADTAPPQVHSISYTDAESLFDAANMNAFNTAVQKLGLQGVSVLVMSGINGVGGFDALDNVTNCAYAPEFPASSPYVTSVGATQGPESGTAEVVCSSLTGAFITSGGGFSTNFAQPAYQKAQVAAYFTNVQTAPVAGYNANGRGYPDVSALGFNYTVAVGGQLGLDDGANNAVFAGMITLINDARLAAGKGPLGFLNPALYSLNANVWTDIVSGDNKCSADPANCCTQGFAAAQGWDPASGLGSPKFQALKQALLAL